MSTYKIFYPNGEVKYCAVAPLLYVFDVPIGSYTKRIGPGSVLWYVFTNKWRIVVVDIPEEILMLDLIT